MDGHRTCYCGQFPELIGSMHTKECYVHCPNCGADMRERKDERDYL